MIVDLPSQGMILHFLSTGIQHEVVDVTDRWVIVKCVDTGHDLDEETLIGSHGSMSYKQWLNWQYEQEFEVIITKCTHIIKKIET